MQSNKWKSCWIFVEEFKNNNGERIKEVFEQDDFFRNQKNTKILPVTNRNKN